MMIIRLSCATLIALISFGCSESGSSAGSSPAPSATTRDTTPPAQIETTPEPQTSVEDAAVEDVLTNMRAQGIGAHTFGDHHCSEAFLRRFADRVIRGLYRRQFQNLYRDAPEHEPLDPSPRIVRAASDAIVVRRTAWSPQILAYRTAQQIESPGLRGFRAPILEDAADFRVVTLAQSSPAADLVAVRLAVDGVLVTLAKTLDLIGQERFVDPDTDALIELRTLGLPIDLVAHFDTETTDSQRAERVIGRIAERLLDGEAVESIVLELRVAPFEFRPTRPGFTVTAEDGERDLTLLRLQATRADYWRGPGAGGSLDIMRQLVEALPNVDFIVSVYQDFGDSFIELAHTWPLDRPAQMTIIVEPLNMAQWAQDNGKPGMMIEARTGATILPRYANRREDGSEFAPGDTYLAEGLAAAALDVFQSSMLFQGGNLLAYRNPKTGERIMLIGEGEVCRNTAMGLTEQQTLDAFRIEFGVDRCVVVPAISFHLDYDVSVRVQDGRLIAFVNDSNAAARIVIECAVRAMERGGLIPAGDADAAVGLLREKRDLEALKMMIPQIYGRANEQMQFPLSLANLFAADPTDSAVGNMHRVLTAMETLMASAVPLEELPPNPNLKVYLETIRRTEAHRQTFHHQLRDLGFEVVPVPSLSDADRSLTTINGIHDRTRYLMPAYGGLFSPLDDAAMNVIHETLGDRVEIVPILTGESQRRHGAVHCSAGVYYDLNGTK